MGLGFLLGLSILMKIGTSALFYYAFGPAAMKVHEKAFVEKYGDIKPPEVVRLTALDRTDIEFLSKICRNEVKLEEGATGAPVTETRSVGFRNQILEHLILAEVIPCNDEFVAIADSAEEHCIFLLRKTKPVRGFDETIFYLNERVCHKPGEDGSFRANCKLVLSQLRVCLYSKVIPSEKSQHTAEVDKKGEQSEEQPDDGGAPALREEIEKIENVLKDEPAAVENSAFGKELPTRKQWDAAEKQQRGAATIECHSNVISLVPLWYL